ncbi:hypothetical protein METEAL_09920 [Mesoterricola silvestris]|uniref:Uncharacterized protein n=1 Tax=Mesoterricola silvestris TaxID=2927979 RepID=A0AA48GWV7_9BACT|nr:hypothetical protein METEAL_09920 [Mesoterricola silvestris]
MIPSVPMTQIRRRAWGLAALVGILLALIVDLVVR